MRSTRRVRPLVFTPLLALALVVCLGSAALAAAAASAPSSGLSAAARTYVTGQQAHLKVAGHAYDEFGSSVAISGDTAVVGATYATVGTHLDQGAAYVFTRSGSTWALQQKLTVPDGASGAYFGRSVAISGDTVVVGADGVTIGTNVQQGATYVYTRSGSTWTLQQRLTAADGAEGDVFGASVAVSGDTVAVGASYDDVGVGMDQGSAYVFTRSGTTWTQQQQLTAADASDSDLFGGAVALEGDTAVVGAAAHTVGSSDGQGASYVFTRSGTTWTQQKQLTAADGAGGDWFGTSVALADDTVFVGALYDDVGANTDQGSAYVFTRSGVTWTQQQRLTATAGIEGADFGNAVALEGDTAVVGALWADAGQGAAYVFTRSAAVWTQQKKLKPADTSDDKWAGSSVAFADGTAVVGAPRENVSGNVSQGAAYVYSCPLAPAGQPTAHSPQGVISSRTPTFKWTAGLWATSYTVRVYRGSTLIRKKEGATATSWKCLLTLPRGVNLTWKVRAYNAAGWSDWSDVLTFKVQ